MLAGVVELVLRLTIAKEKIELSVPISSAVCVYYHMYCVCDSFLVCVRVLMCLYSCAHLCLCVCCAACCRGHSCSTIIFPM